MCSLELNDIQEGHAKILGCIKELEDKIKSNKRYWSCDDSNLDPSYLQTLINGHFTEIQHHLNQIRHHTDRINLHCDELEKLHAAQPQDEACVRLQEEKSKLKNRRATRTGSLKSVMLWEKMLEDKKEAGQSQSVDARSNDNGENETEVSNLMVKHRVLHFEGIKKSKRASSTVETFLDVVDETPKRISSYPITEENEDEGELKQISTNDCGDNSESDDTKNNNNQDDDINGNCDKNEEVKILEQQINDKLNIDSDLNEKSDPNIVNATNLEEKAPCKPRVVEIRYKQNILPEA